MHLIYSTFNSRKYNNQILKWLHLNDISGYLNINLFFYTNIIKIKPSDDNLWTS